MQQTTQSAGRKKGIRGSSRPNFEGWLYVMPSLIINVAFLLLPVIATIFLAFTSWNGFGTPTWVGLKNFEDLFATQAFWSALTNNVKWTIIFLTVPIILGLITAAALLQVKRLRFLQIVFLIPYILPTVVQARLWQGMIFNPETGVLGWLAKHGLNIPDPLIHTSSSLYGIALVNVWAWWGFLAMVFLAAMRQVDINLLDASRVEGATFLQRFRYVLLPSIRPTLTFMLVMTIVWSFLVFDYIYILTQGGPAGSSEVLSTLAYQYGFKVFEFGKAAAVSAFSGLLGLLAIGAYLWLQRRGIEQ